MRLRHFRISKLLCRLMVGQRTLTPLILVRIQAKQPTQENTREGVFLCRRCVEAIKSGGEIQSLLNNESPEDFKEQEPFRNAISKVYISHSYSRNLKRGDNIVFYRTEGVHKGVITTIGVVHKIYFPKTFEQFKEVCRRKSIFSAEELKRVWDKYRNWSSPFVIEFLYSYSFPKPKINLLRLIKDGIIKDSNSVPRGFELLSQEKVNKILEITRADESYIVN